MPRTAHSRHLAQRQQMCRLECPNQLLAHLFAQARQVSRFGECPYNSDYVPRLMRAGPSDSGGNPSLLVYAATPTCTATRFRPTAARGRSRATRTIRPTATVRASGGGKIAFTSDRDGNPEIYVMD